MSDDKSRCVVLSVPVEQSDNIEEAKARVRTKHLAISHPRRLCAVLSTEGWPTILWKADANGAVFFHFTNGRTIKRLFENGLKRLAGRDSNCGCGTQRRAAGWWPLKRRRSVIRAT